MGVSSDSGAGARSAYQLPWVEMGWSLLLGVAQGRVPFSVIHGQKRGVRLRRIVRVLWSDEASIYYLALDSALEVDSQTTKGYREGKDPKT